MRTGRSPGLSRLNLRPAPGWRCPRPVRRRRRTRKSPARDRAPRSAMRPGGAVRFALELARGPGGAVRAGERLRGRVLLEVAGPLRVRALEVAARGGAAAHWLEARSVGGRAVTRDFTAAETLLRWRQLLLPGEARGPHSGAVHGPRWDPARWWLLPCPEPPPPEGAHPRAVVRARPTCLETLLQAGAPRGNPAGNREPLHGS